MTTATTAPPLLDAAAALASGETVVGGKALGLARLVAVGARVPAFFVMPASRFAERLRRAGLLGEVEDALARFASGPADAPGFAALQARVLLRLARDRDDRPALDGAIASLGPGPWAVRSSAVGEDSAERSFAGQHDSVLARGDPDAVAEAVARCQASALGRRALAYRLATGGGLDAAAVLSIAVVVQRMVQPRAAGVLFTRHPADQGPGRQLVSAAYGLGDGVVGGGADADEYTWTADDGEVAARVAVKHVRSAPSADAPSGTVEEAVPPSLADRRVLARDEVAAICREGARLEQAFGHALDVEWAIDGDGTLHLLQARPIVARAPVAPSDAGARAVVFDNSNIQESYCGVTTPLTFSFARRAYASVYEQTMLAVGLPESVVAAHRPMLGELLALIAGRVYYNIDNWYRGLLLLPSFGRNKADMERMMGLDEPVDFVQDQRRGSLDTLRRLPALAGTAARLLTRFRTLDRDVERFLADFEREYAALDRTGFAALPLGELTVVIDRLRTRLLERWTVPIINDFRVMMIAGRLRRIVRRASADEAAAEARYHALLADDRTVASLEPTRRLIALAGRIEATPSLREALVDGPAAAALARVRALDPAVDAELAEWIERFGDRSMGELKLETVTLRQDPTFIARVLRNYVATPPADQDSSAAADVAARASLAAEVMAALPPWRRGAFRRTLDAARRAVRAREATRLARTRLFGLYRDAYLAIGARLHERGRLAGPRDVFYLTVEELGGFARGTAAAVDFAPVARARRAEFAAYEAVAAPNRVVVRGAPADAVARMPRVAPAAGGPAVPAVLRGTGVSAGVAEAVARVVASAGDDLALAGTVLVALRTDPGWTPLFPGLAAVVVERGSALSHSAVLARELGIPCVVGVPGLLAAVRDGCRVRVDGAAGTVEVLA